MHEALTPPSSSSSDSPYSFTRHASTVTAITGCWLPMPSSGIRSSRSGVSRVVWRARPQDRSTLGPSRVRLTEPLQATALPQDGPPLSFASMRSSRSFARRAADP